MTINDLLHTVSIRHTIMNLLDYLSGKRLEALMPSAADWEMLFSSLT